MKEANKNKIVSFFKVEKLYAAFFFGAAGKDAERTETDDLPPLCEKRKIGKKNSRSNRGQSSRRA
jgi:hypothetical protein